MLWESWTIGSKVSFNACLDSCLFAFQKASNHLEMMNSYEQKKEEAIRLNEMPERRDEFQKLIQEVEEKYLAIRSLNEEKQNLIVTAVYLYENALRKIDFKIEQVKNNGELG